MQQTSKKIDQRDQKSKTFSFITLCYPNLTHLLNMAQVLSLKIPKKKKFFVKELEGVNQGSVLVEGEKKGRRETISITQVFKITPSQIFKVLVKKLGDKVQKGEILAKKEGIFGRTILKSPIDGRLVEASQVLGEVILEGKEEKVIIKSPVSGRVREIKDEEIKIEFEGQVFEGKKGGGERVFGVIENLPFDVGVLDLSSSIVQKILVCQFFSPPVLAKSWALEAAGVVGTSYSSKQSLFPFLVVGKRDIEELKNYQGKKAILEPEEKRLIVLLE